MSATFETKKDSLRQTQDGLWKLTLTVLPEDMPVELLQAPMGTPYGLAMVPIDYDNPTVTEKNQSNSTPLEKPEGVRLRIRACALCNDREFQEYAQHNIELHADWNDFDTNKELARHGILVECDIDSRKELDTNLEAQEKFKKLLEEFDKWKVSRRYLDNLERD